MFKYISKEKRHVIGQGKGKIYLSIFLVFLSTCMLYPDCEVFSRNFVMVTCFSQMNTVVFITLKDTSRIQI